MSITMAQIYCGGGQRCGKLRLGLCLQKDGVKAAFDLCVHKHQHVRYLLICPYPLWHPDSASSACLLLKKSSKHDIYIMRVLCVFMFALRKQQRGFLVLWSLLSH